MIQMMDLCLWQLDFLDVIEVALLFDVVHQGDASYSAFVLPPSNDWLTPRQDFHICRVIYFDPFVTWSKDCRVAIGGQNWDTDKVVP